MSTALRRLLTKTRVVQAGHTPKASPGQLQPWAYGTGAGSQGNESIM